MGYLGDWWNSGASRQQAKAMMPAAETVAGTTAVKAAPIQIPNSVFGIGTETLKSKSDKTGKQAFDSSGRMIEGVEGTFAGGPGAYLGRQSEVVEGQAQREAAQTADLATKQAAKGAKTAGMMTGQAALAAARGGADAYGGALAGARQSLRDQYSQAAGMQTGALGTMAGIGGEAEKARLATRAQNLDLAGKVISGGAEVAKVAIPLSDKNAKTDIKPVSMGDSLSKIKAYAYRYKGSPDQQTGVMAQDLEKGAFAPAVVEMGGQKRVDSGKLSLQNTAALSEHEKKLREIEKIVKSLEGAKRG